MTHHPSPSFALPLLFATLAGAMACDTGTGTEPEPSDDDVVDHRVDLPAPQDHVIQFAQPETVIQPGEEKMICWIPDWVPERSYLVSQFVGLQSPFGHHVVALQSAIPRQAGDQWDCTQNEAMTSVNPLILPDLATQKLLPEGFAVRLPVDSQIVIQSHYINYGEDPIRISDVAQFITVPEEDEAAQTIASYFIANHGQLNLPPGESSANIECDIDEDLNIIVMLGHMHERGKSFSATLSDGADDQMLYEIDAWTNEYRDVPPVSLFPDTDPLVMDQGKHLTVTCNYDNQTGENITFPEEMCVLVGYYFPARDAEDPIVFCN